MVTYLSSFLRHFWKQRGLVTVVPCGIRSITGSGHNPVGGIEHDSLTRDRPQVVDPDAELST
jgi:hypothetical protein